MNKRHAAIWLPKRKYQESAIKSSDSVRTLFENVIASNHAIKHFYQFKMYICVSTLYNSKNNN